MVILMLPTTQVNGPRAYGVAVPPASGSVGRVVGRYSGNTRIARRAPAHRASRPIHLMG
jgi:hypothetical protein